MPLSEREPEVEVGRGVDASSELGLDVDPGVLAGSSSSIILDTPAREREAGRRRDWIRICREIRALGADLGPVGYHESTTGM